MYTTPDVVAQRAATVEALRPAEGESILDIGAGNGFLAGELGDRVGETGQIVGIDTSESMVAMAQARCADQPWVRFEVGDATALAFGHASFDAAVSAQVFSYIPDVNAALRETYRILKPGGHFVLLDTDWNTMSWNSSDPERMSKIMKIAVSHSADAFLPMTLTPRLMAAGFEIIDRAAFPIFNPEYDPETYSYGLIGMIASSLPTGDGLAQEEVDAWVADLHETGRNGDYFFSINRFIFVARKPA